MRKALFPLAIALFLLPGAGAQEQVQPRLAATLRWSEAYSVGKPHGGSGLRVTGLEVAKWQARSRLITWKGCGL